MRVVFLIGFAAVLLSSCLCNDEENKRKYVGQEEGYKRQVGRLEEILSLGIFSTRQSIPLVDILDLINLILEILNALEGLLPTEPSTAADPTATTLAVDPTATTLVDPTATTAAPVDPTATTVFDATATTVDPTATTLCKKK